MAEYTYNGLTQKEWLNEGRAYYVKHGSMKGWKNKNWIREDGEKMELFSKRRPTTPKEVIEKGEHMHPRKASVRESFRSNRAQREEVPERLRERFDTDAEFEEYKRYVKSGNTEGGRLASQSSSPGKKFNKGHIAALGAGGSHDPMAQRLESETGNKSTQHEAEIPRDRLVATGTPRDWDEAVTLYQNPELVPTELTPQDKQRIWRGEDPDLVYSQRQTAIDQNPLARPNPNRVRRVAPRLEISNGSFRFKPGIGGKLGKLAQVPLLGGVAAGALTLSTGGSPAQAAGAFVEAENPLENLDAGPIFNESQDYGDVIRQANQQNAVPLMDRLQSGVLGTRQIKGRRSPSKQNMANKQPPGVLGQMRPR